MVMMMTMTIIFTVFNTAFFKITQFIRCFKFHGNMNDIMLF